jgi:hypothetical protein
VDDVVIQAQALSPDQANQPARPDAGPALGDSPSDLGFTERIVTIMLAAQSVRSIAKLVEKLSEIKGVVSVNAGDVNVPSE